MTDEMAKKATDATEETKQAAEKAAKDVTAKTTKAAKDATESTVSATADVDTTEVQAAADELAADVEDLVEAVGVSTADAVEQGKQTVKDVTAKGKKTAKGALDALTADLEMLDAQVKAATDRSRETIDASIVDAGVATSADIRKALEDLIVAIENQRVFVDARKAFESALSSFEKSQTVSFVRQTTDETVQEVRRRPLRDMLQKVLFAGIGAAALTRDEVEAFVNRMVQRGDIPADEAEAVVEDVMATSKKQAARLDAEVDKRVKVALKQGDVPTVEDIEDLNAKIAALQRKVEELSKKAS